jgi:hypothetical protein
MNSADKSFTRGVAEELADILVPILRERLAQQTPIQKLLTRYPTQLKCLAVVNVRLNR